MLKRFLTTKIKQKLELKFPNTQVINESAFHSRGENSHFKIVIISPDFKGKGPLDRRREILKDLHEFWALGVHSISIFPYTPEEAPEKILPSPKCVNSKQNNSN